MDIWGFITTYWSQIITAVVALYAAGLSTINFWDRRKDEKKKEAAKIPKVKVELVITPIIRPPRVPPGFPANKQDFEPIPCMAVNLTNIGEQSIVIIQLEYAFTNDRRYKFTGFENSAMTPFVLDPRDFKEFAALVELKAIKTQASNAGLSGKVKVIGYCKESLGKEFLSEPLEINIDG